MNYYAWKMREPRSQCFSPQINNWHSWQLKISKSWGLVWRYQLNSAASLANLAYFLGKWAGLAVLFSWYVAPKWPQDFDFFNCHWCQTFILAENHCYLSTLKSCNNNSFLSGVCKLARKNTSFYSIHLWISCLVVSIWRKKILLFFARIPPHSSRLFMNL